MEGKGGRNQDLRDVGMFRMKSSIHLQTTVSIYELVVKELEN